MPKPHSSVVKKFHSSRKRPVPRNAHSSAKTLATPTAPSPSLGDLATTEADMTDWVGWFARFHSEPSCDVPYALRSVDCRVDVRDQKDQPPRRMRCVREVAKTDGPDGVEWRLIVWVVGLPGMQFQRCASLDEAMQRLDAPPETVSF